MGDPNEKLATQFSKILAIKEKFGTVLNSFEEYCGQNPLITKAEQAKILELKEDLDAIETRVLLVAGKKGITLGFEKENIDLKDKKEKVLNLLGGEEAIETIGDLYVTLVANFKVESLAIFSSKGDVVFREQQIETPSLIEIKQKFNNGIYYVALLGFDDEIDAKKIVYMASKESERPSIFVKITHFSDSIYSVLGDVAKMKDAVLEKIKEYTKQYGIYSASHNLYLQQNASTFFIATSSHSGLSVGRDFLNKVIAGASSNRAATIFEKVGGEAFVKSKISKGIIGISTALGASFGSAPGAVAGFLVGTIVDVFMNYLVATFLPDDGDVAVAENSKRINNYINSLNNEMDNRLATAYSELEDAIRPDTVLAYQSKDEKELIKIFEIYEQGIDVLKQSMAPKGSKKLADELLKIWLKENAGDDSDDGNRYVNNAQWEMILDDLKKKGKLPMMDYGLANQWDVFAYQFRAELSRWGITSTHVFEEMLKCATTNGSIDNITSEYNQKPIWFFPGKEITDFEAFIKFAIHTDDNRSPYSRPIKGRREDWKESFDAKAFKFSITMDLIQDDNSIFVTRFNYYLELDAKKMGYSSYLITKFEWYENVDN